jgi:hypothetical protein
MQKVHGIDVMICGENQVWNLPEDANVTPELLGGQAHGDCLVVRLRDEISSF